MTIAIWAYLVWELLIWLGTVWHDPAKKIEPLGSPNTIKAIRIIYRTVLVCFAVGLVVTR